MLSEYDVLRIIAEFTAEQIHSADVRGVVLDADPYRDRIAGLQRQMVKHNLRYLQTIHKGSVVGDFPDFQQPIL